MGACILKCIKWNKKWVVVHHNGDISDSDHWLTIWNLHPSIQFMSCLFSLGSLEPFPAAWLRGEVLPGLFTSYSQSINIGNLGISLSMVHNIKGYRESGDITACERHGQNQHWMNAGDLRSLSHHCTINWHCEKVLHGKHITSEVHLWVFLCLFVLLYMGLGVFKVSN